MIEHDDSRTALCLDCLKCNDCMPGYTSVDLDYGAKIYEVPATPDECKEFMPKIKRCAKTLNPVCTDTWLADNPCQCANCQEFFYGVNKDYTPGLSRICTSITDWQAICTTPSYAKTPSMQP